MKKKNVSIQLIRVIAMIMIIMDHLLRVIDIPMDIKSFIVQIANSGVFIFLFISGYLLGQKEVYCWKKWIFHRLTRIIIPLWIFMIFDFLIEFIVLGNFDIKYVFYYLFNVQGIFGCNYTGGTLWFVTLIMICYLITPLLQFIKKIHISKIIIVMVIILVVGIQILLAYTTDVGMVYNHPLSWCIFALGVYTIGYFVGPKVLPDQISIKRIVIVSLITALLCIAVLVSKKYYGEEIWYQRILFFYGIIIVDYWICTILYLIGKFIKKQATLYVLNHIDNISYEFYIVHWAIIVFITKPLYEYCKVNTVIYIMATVVFAYVGACLLHVISSFVLKPINKWEKRIK